MQVPPEVLKCVVFLGCRKASDIEWKATGFLFTVPIDGTPLLARYLVTARHVIEEICKLSNDGKVHVRLNTSTGASTIDVDIQDFVFPASDQIDLAISSWKHDLLDLNHNWIPFSLLANNEVLAQENIGIGDTLFFPGLFVSNVGDTHNTPIVRMGSIAAMPGEKVITEWGPIKAYLAEARSIGGLSGSPVFVDLSSMRHTAGKILEFRGQSFSMIGIVHGHFERNVRLRDMNMGIAIVTPADALADAIQSSPWIEHRDQIRALCESETSITIGLDPVE